MRLKSEQNKKINLISSSLFLLLCLLLHCLVFVLFALLIPPPCCPPSFFFVGFGSSCLPPAQRRLPEPNLSKHEERSESVVNSDQSFVTFEQKHTKTKIHFLLKTVESVNMTST